MIVSTPNQAPSFSAQCWITGIAGFTDSDPNTVAPAANRIIQCPGYIFNMPTAVTQFGVTAVAYAADGTAATPRMWMRDDGISLWVPVSSGLTAMTFAAGNTQQIQIRCTPGAQYFCQITANTGVTKIAFFIR